MGKQVGTLDHEMKKTIQVIEQGFDRVLEYINTAPTYKAHPSLASYANYGEGVPPTQSVSAVTTSFVGGMQLATEVPTNMDMQQHPL